jgi:hypothetical protein
VTVLLQNGSSDDGLGEEESDMDKRIAGLLGAAAALTTTHGGAAAAPGTADLARLRQPKSYAELLEPIPNAVTLRKSDDESRAVSGPVERVRYYHHHHHHHHHGYFRRYNYNGGYYPRFYLRRYHHHHHHHHHHSYFRGY